MQKLLITFLVLVSFQTVFAGEPTLRVDIEKTYLTKVESILHSETKLVPGTNTEAVYQTIKVKVTEGEEIGKEITLDDSTYGVEVGDKVYIKYLKTAEGSEYYSMSEPYRIPQIGWLFVLFLVCVLVFGGKQGFLALIALFVSCFSMVKILFPNLLAGEDPIFLSSLVTVLALGIVMYVTHGFRRFTTAAYVGCLVAVGITAILSHIAVLAAHITGFASEESVYLNMATGNLLNFQSLIISSMIVGVIGVVNDAAITQTSLVQEFFIAHKTMSRWEVYKHAMKVGRDHIGALVNTLVFAYVGASLPVLLLFYTSVATTPLLELINREMIATEIIRSMIGSIGLLLAIPCSTLIAVWIIKRDVSPEDTMHTHHH